jgi:ATP-binding cassette subfamily B (MDR/TAP) protein 1
LFTYTAIRTTSTLRAKFLEATLNQEIGFFDSTGPGATAVRVTTNSNLVNTGIAEKAGIFLQGISMTITGLIVAFTQDWKLTLITSTIMPAMIIIVGITIAIDSMQESRILAIYSQASSFAEEVLGTVKTVYAFGAVSDLASKFDEWLDAASIQGLKKTPNLAVLYSSEYFVVFSGYALAFWQGVQMFADGRIASSGIIIT